MLNVIRAQHTKRILWVVAITVIVAFVLSGANSFLNKKESKVTAEVNGRRIPIPNFPYYIELARLDYALYTNLQDKPRKTTPEQILEKAGVYFRLLWKAKQEGLSTSDQEVVNWINRNFSQKGKFDQDFYQRYLAYISRSFGLNLTPRSFEEYMRELITVDKVWEKFIQVEVSDEEMRSLYLADNQQAKIAYLFIPYEKFRVDIGIKPKEIEEFYQKNKNLFREEPKADIIYMVIDRNNQFNPEEMKSLSGIKTIDELKEKTNLEVKETGFISKNEPLGEIGWQPEISQVAFGLAINQVSQPLSFANGSVIVGKKAEKPAFTPALGEIKPEVKEALINDRAREETKQFCRDLLKEITERKEKNLSKFAKRKNIEFKETGYFKSQDYIEGLGLNPKVNQIVFSLENDAIHPEIIALVKGVCILQLKDKTPLDEEDFTARKPTYYDKIRARKEFGQKLTFLSSLIKEITLDIPLPD